MSRSSLHAVCLLVLLHNCFGEFDKWDPFDRPNIILILTDDQDIELSGMDFMPKLKSLMTDQGTYFKNMFVTTPVCCCSRATILSGRYMHNHKTLTNSLEDGCNGDYWRTVIEPTSFPVLLKKSGYKTFYSGKYLNHLGGKDTVGGRSHVPPGYDFWATQRGKPAFFNYEMSINGSMRWFGSTVNDYITNVILRHAKTFLKTVRPNTPFFLALAPTAPHTPADTLPPYTHMFLNRTAPRTPHYGLHGKDKHWVIRSMPEHLPKDVAQNADEIFRKRLRSLLPVDDMVQQIVDLLKNMGVYKKTYIIYTSDNGFQLGQFNLPYDKRHLYEFDVRVPLIITGPGVKKGAVRNEPVLNLDLAPTILRMARVPVPDYMEGRPLMRLLKSPYPQTRWRKAFLIEYNGEPTPKHKRRGESDDNLYACYRQDIYRKSMCVDARNNTYIQLYPSPY